MTRYELILELRAQVTTITNDARLQRDVEDELHRTSTIVLHFLYTTNSLPEFIKLCFGNIPGLLKPQKEVSQDGGQ